jgi:hypothetical protein
VTNLNTPTLCEYGNDFVYVYSLGDKSILKFTDNLNFVSKFGSERLFEENNVVGLTYNKLKNQLYILTDTFDVTILDAQTMTIVDTFTFRKNPFEVQIPFLGFFEKPRKIAFSENNSNVMYLQTDKNIYKYFISTQNDLIGSLTIDYNLGEIPYWNTTFTAFSATTDTWEQLPDFDQFFFTGTGIHIQSTDENFDRVLVLSNTKIYEFLEENKFVSLLNDTSAEFYGKSEILIQDEFFNNITLNQSIFRILHNFNTLSIILGRQLAGEFQLNGYLIFRDIIDLGYEEKRDLEIDDEKQFFVGINETVNGNTLNRCFLNLFKYQEKFINNINTKILNERVPNKITVFLP